MKSLPGKEEFGTFSKRKENKNERSISMGWNREKVILRQFIKENRDRHSGPPSMNGGERIRRR